MLPTDALADVAALLAGASTTPERGARVVYLATARARLDAAAERLRELRRLLEAQERALVAAAGPAQTSIATTESR